jgi:hypothetical protein
MTVVAPAAASLALDVLLGDWRNTNAEGSLARIVCRANENDAIDVRIFGRFGGADEDWGSVSASVFAFTFDDAAAGAFCAHFERGKTRIDLQANVKLGVLVVVELTAFDDGSGRSNFFDREFFHRVSKP